MNAREEGFLLLSSTLGDPNRRPLTTAQLRSLGVRMAAMPRPTQDRDLAAADLIMYPRTPISRKIPLAAAQAAVSA